MGKTLADSTAGGALHAAWQTDFNAAMPSVDERMATGKALREKAPHKLHAEYRPASNRRDPVAILEEQARTRLPFLVPLRYARMLVSPFAFLRGSAAIVAGDLANTPVTGVPVQACGDAHVGNFGCSHRQSVTWFLRSTISTRRCLDLGNGI